MNGAVLCRHALNNVPTTLTATSSLVDTLTAVKTRVAVMAPALLRTFEYLCKGAMPDWFCDFPFTIDDDRRDREGFVPF